MLCVLLFMAAPQKYAAASNGKVRRVEKLKIWPLEKGTIFFAIALQQYVAHCTSRKTISHVCAYF